MKSSFTLRDAHRIVAMKEAGQIGSDHPQLSLSLSMIADQIVGTKRRKSKDFMDRRRRVGGSFEGGRKR